MIIANSALRASLAIYHFISNACSWYIYVVSVKLGVTASLPVHVISVYILDTSRKVCPHESVNVQNRTSEIFDKNQRLCI